MPEIPGVSAEEAIRALQKAGFIVLRYFPDHSVRRALVAEGQPRQCERGLAGIRQVLERTGRVLRSVLHGAKQRFRVWLPRGPALSGSSVLERLRRDDLCLDG